MAEKCNLLIVGGGTGGIAVAAHVKKHAPDTCGDLSITLIEPKEVHYYQPGWTLVGGGEMKVEKTRRPMKEVVPEGVNWVQDRVVQFQPEKNLVVTEGGKEIQYDRMVVAAGIEIAWDQVPGLEEALKENIAVTIYDYNYAPLVWEKIRSFDGGRAIFTQPKPPFKCPGAAQKIMYLADDAWRKRNVRGKSTIKFYSAAPGIFPVRRYAKTLNEVLKRKAIDTVFKHHLVAIDPARREATFEPVEGGEKIVETFDFLHVTPPMRAPKFLRESPLAAENGFLDVDLYTLRHKRFENIYGLGDCVNLPCSKTAAAARAQTYIVTSNLLTDFEGGKGMAGYDGYASCPLITGYGRLVLAEFDYNLKPKETFPIDQSKERRTMYWFKKYFLPWYYWEVLLKGGDAPIPFIG